MNDSVTGTCAVLAKTCGKTHRVPVPHLAAGFVACFAGFPLDLAGRCQPPGGTSNRGPQWGPNGSPAKRVPLGEDERRNE